jgi:hypothetical protein
MHFLLCCNHCRQRLGLGFCFTLWDNRQRERLQIEPADSFRVFGIQSMPFLRNQAALRFQGDYDGDW